MGGEELGGNNHERGAGFFRQEPLVGLTGFWKVQAGVDIPRYGLGHSEKSFGYVLRTEAPLAHCTSSFALFEPLFGSLGFDTPSGSSFQPLV